LHSVIAVVLFLPEGFTRPLNRLAEGRRRALRHLRRVRPDSCIARAAPQVAAASGLAGLPSFVFLTDVEVKAQDDPQHQQAEQCDSLAPRLDLGQLVLAFL